MIFFIQLSAQGDADTLAVFFAQLAEIFSGTVRYDRLMRKPCLYIFHQLFQVISRVDVVKSDCFQILMHLLFVFLKILPAAF